MALRIGIVGAGRRGFQKARLLETFPDIQIAGIAEPNRPIRDSFADMFGAKLAVSDHRRLAVDKEIDLIYICSPPSTHSSIAITSLGAGKHVICEQPMAIKINEAEDMMVAAEESGSRLFIAMPERYDPLFQHVSKLLFADEIGYPFLALVSYLIDDYERMNDWHDWKGTWGTGGGGVLMDKGSGVIDILQHYLGDVDAVSAMCTRFAIEPLDKAEDTCLMALEFIEEATAEFAITGAARFSPWPEKYSGTAFRMEIYALDGSIQILNSAPRVVVITKEKKHEVIPETEIKTGLPANMDRDFLDCIFEGKEPLVTSEHALNALKIILAGYKAAQMKRRVEILEQL